MTLDAPATGNMKFVTAVYECVVPGYGEWKKNVCSENNSTRHASLQAYHNSTGRDSVNPPATGYSDIGMYPYFDRDIRNNANAQKTGKYWVHTYKMITIPAGQMSGSTSWETRTNMDRHAESILVMVKPMGPKEYKMRHDGTVNWHRGDGQYAGTYAGKHFWETKIGGTHEPVLFFQDMGFDTTESKAAITSRIAINPIQSVNIGVNTYRTMDGDFARHSYELGHRVVTLYAGSSAQSAQITLIDDNVDEPDGSATIEIRPGTGYIVGYPHTVTFTILDNDPGPLGSGAPLTPPTVSVNIASGGSEGDPVTFGISAAPSPLQASLPVNVTLSGTGDILNASEAGWRIITIPQAGYLSLNIPTLDDAIQDNNTVTLTINPGDGYELGLFSTWTVDVQDNGLPPQEQQDTPLTLESRQAEQYTAVEIDPVLITNVTIMASQTQHGQEHVDRWTRVLIAFGEIDGTNPMTAAEAKTNSERHSSPLWPQIADILVLLEATSAQDTPQDTPQDIPQQDQQQDPQQAIDPALLSGIREQASQTQHGTDHVDRWTRVLAAFGEAEHDNPMTATEARANVEQYSSPLWSQIADILEARQ